MILIFFLRFLFLFVFLQIRVPFIQEGKRSMMRWYIKKLIEIRACDFVWYLYIFRFYYFSFSFVVAEVAVRRIFFADVDNYAFALCPKYAEWS